MTHKTFKILGVAETRQNSLRVVWFPDDAAEYFTHDEWLWSREFSKVKVGYTYQVSIRVNPAANKKIRRYIMSVNEHSEGMVVENLASTASETEVSEIPSTVVSKISFTDLLEKQVAAFNYYIRPEHIEMLNAATLLQEYAPAKPVKILVSGPSGYGKTTLGTVYAASRGMEVYRMNCATVRDPEEWFGFRAATEGSTHFVPSKFSEKVMAGNCVIILDEFNRIEPWLTNTLYPLLDDDAATEIYNERITVGPNVVFMMTINVGVQFSGTFVMDEALTNRVDLFAQVDVLPLHVENEILQRVTGIDKVTATKIISAATKIRGMEIIECSVRSTLRIAKLVKTGLEPRAAFQHVIVSRCAADAALGDDAKRQLIDVLNASVGVYEVTKF